jgi:hypothetical protein
MLKGPAPVKGDVVIMFEGRKLTASYSVADGMVTVHTHNGSKTTQVGNVPADSLARLMLREMAQEGKA